ncbi:leucine-rich repeat-containing protein 74B-like isoform X1 [Haliotis rufescens]|uniref:leucine-rich repeat-containing protein 74B-like isoform X1 n=2 Tax=Haliotis rufescens TaxID=6454 RepID=UPI00201F2F6B|nr:leucine-rich repeat-containing protein 74B-like isoform X1 [Haliotis rufescens]XP_048237097.1 leucine-rich repeat-containing protein 74B-like isoform X1 [Haliotis rufescens]
MESVTASKRSCDHSGKPNIRDTKSAPSESVRGTKELHVVEEEDEGYEGEDEFREDGIDTVKPQNENVKLGGQEDRPATAESGPKSVRMPGSRVESVCSRYGSSTKLDSRPSTGTRVTSAQGGRRTISRASSRRSRRGSATSRNQDRGHSSESEEDGDGRDINSEMELRTVDIHDDKAWDTDLEGEESSTSYDHTGKTAYIECCKRLGIIPASYFLRHMQEKELVMKHHGLGAQGMKAIAMALVSNTTVLNVNLRDNWLGSTGGFAICDMLKENCFITEIDLSDNRLGTVVAAALSQILTQNDTLRRVTLAGNEFDDKAAGYFADALLGATKIEYLNLSHNNFGESAGIALGPAISENTSLKELDLSWNHLRRKGAIAVAMGVKNNVFMKKVNLSWNGFGLEGSIALADAVKNNSVLEELDIGNNRITTEGAVLIGKGLSLNETLQVLKMGQNPMQTGGCWAICAAILKNPSCVLRHIDFSDILVNEDFTEIFKQVQEQIPDIKIWHGGMEPPLKPKARIPPMMKLATYIDKHDLRLVDFFNKFDKDKSMSVTHEEFIQGLEKFQKETGINLTEEEIASLIEELDKDGDGEINYSEMVIGHTDFKETQRLSVTSMRPLTS